MNRCNKGGRCNLARQIAKLIQIYAISLFGKTEKAVPYGKFSAMTQYEYKKYFYRGYLHIISAQ